MIRNTSVNGSSTKLQGSAATGDPKWLRTARSQDLPWSTSNKKENVYGKGDEAGNEVSDEFYNIVGRRDPFCFERGFTAVL